MNSKSFKKKGSSRITQREFMMLSILVLAIELFIIVQYIVTPIYDEYRSVKEMNDSRELINNSLKTDFENLDKYNADLNTALDEVNIAKAAIPSYVSQEEVLLLLDKFSAVSLANVSLIGFIEPLVVGADTLDATQSVENPVQTNAIPLSEITDTQVPLIINQTISVGFDGEYNEIIGFLKALEANERRIYVDQIALSSADGGILNGSMNLSFISYVDKGNFEKFLMETIPFDGKMNPFAPYTGVGEGTPVAVAPVYDPNIYILLNSYLDNAQKIIMGEYPDAQTEINFNQNSEASVKLTFTGDATNFNYTMSLGNSTKRSNESVKIENGAIRVKIVSLERRDSKDLVGIQLNVDNQTNVPVEVEILFDDGTKPRVRIGALSNNVTIK